MHDTSLPTTLLHAWFLQMYSHKWQFHRYIEVLLNNITSLHNNIFTDRIQSLHRFCLQMLLFVIIFVHTVVTNFSRSVTALHSKSERVSFIILTVMVSSELDTEVACISVVFNVTLLSLLVLGGVVPPTTTRMLRTARSLVISCLSCSARRMIAITRNGCLFQSITRILRPRGHSGQLRWLDVWNV